MGLLEMQRAEFEIKNQNLGSRFRADDVVRRLESVNGGIATHEADHGSFDRGGKAKMTYYFEIQAWRVESGARRDNHMRDPLPFFQGQSELVQRAVRQLWGKL